MTLPLPHVFLTLPLNAYDIMRNNWGVSSELIFPKNLFFLSNLTDVSKTCRDAYNKNSLQYFFVKWMSCLFLLSEGFFY